MLAVHHGSCFSGRLPCFCWASAFIRSIHGASSACGMDSVRGRFGDSLSTLRRSGLPFTLVLITTGLLVGLWRFDLVPLSDLHRLRQFHVHTTQDSLRRRLTHRIEQTLPRDEATLLTGSCMAIKCSPSSSAISCGVPDCSILSRCPDRT